MFDRRGKMIIFPLPFYLNHKKQLILPKFYRSRFFGQIHYKELPKLKKIFLSMPITSISLGSIIDQLEGSTIPNYQ